MQIDITAPDVTKALQSLIQVPGDTMKHLRAAFTRIALLVQREAIRNAPRSPSQKVINALRKTRRKTTKKARAVSRANPGGLERSIMQEVTSAPDEVSGSVYVAANGEAGKYAERIHDQKGLTWSKLGPGTIQKGSRADEKFIERAVMENEAGMITIIESEIKKAGLI